MKLTHVAPLMAVALTGAMCTIPRVDTSALVTTTHGVVVEQIAPRSTGIRATITIRRMGKDTFLQAYDGALGKHPQYLGIQSTAGKWTAVWSVFDNGDGADLDPYDGSTGVAGTNTKGDGTYISIQAPVNPAKSFTLSITPVANGWDQFSVNGHPVGKIFISGYYSTHGSAWAEYYPNDYAAHPVTPPAISASVLVVGT